MARFHFHERKRLKLPGAVFVSIGVTLVIIILVSLKDRQLSNDEIWLIVGFVLLEIAIQLFFRSWVLDITIDQGGIHYKFPPRIRKSRTISWDQVAHLAIVRYDPIGQFLGWGYRRHPKRGQMASTGGSLGLYITVGGGDHLLLGIEDVDSLRSYLSAQPAAADAWNGGEIIRLK